MTEMKSTVRINAGGWGEEAQQMVPHTFSLNNLIWHLAASLRSFPGPYGSEGTAVMVMVKALLCVDQECWVVQL
jgi:hypothetical protein